MSTTRRALVSSLMLLVAGLAIYGARSSNSSDQNRFASARGSMNTARANAASVLLKSGKVLIIGGKSQRGVLSSVETYDSATGFQYVAAMAFPRTDHGAAILPDGRVLVAGGRSNSGAVLSDTEIYDPATDSWTTGPEMASPHAAATVSLLKNGRILIAGGDSGSGASDRLELFNPANSTFSSLEAHLSSPRMQHAAAVLEDGTVLIGGGTNGETTLDSVDRFYPASLKVSPAGHLSAARSGLSATTLLSGRVVFVGGNTGKTDVGVADVFDPETSKFTTEGAYLSVPRSGHTAIRVKDNNTVLFIGGTSNGKATAQTETYIPWRHTFQQGSQLASARTGITVSAMSARGQVIAIGGQIAYGSVLADGETKCVPTITTDQADYAPDTPVTFTGTCWVPGGHVTISMTEDPYLDQPTSITVEVDGEGNFSNSTGFAPDINDLGTKFYVTATESDALDSNGKALTAQTSFTDGAGTATLTILSSPPPASTNTIYKFQFVNTSPGGQKGGCFTINWPTTDFTSAGTSVFKVDSTTLAGVTSTSPNWSTATVGQVSGNTPGYFTVFANAAAAQLNTGDQVTLEINVTTPATANSYVWTAQGEGGTNVNTANQCSANNFGPISYSQTVGVTPTTTTASASPSSPTYGSAVTLTASVSSTPTGVSGGTVSFYTSGTCAAPGTQVGTAQTFSGNPVSVSSSTLPAGGYTVIACYSGTAAYGPSSGTTAFNVNKAQLTVKADDQSKKYNGSVFSPFTSTITGFVNGDTASVVAGSASYSGTAVTAVNWGSYTITPAVGSLTATNYAFTTFNNGSLTINKADATVVVANYTVPYDGLAHNASVTSITGVNGETGATVGTVDVSNTAHTGANTYSSDSWSFTGTTNYNNIANTTITDKIDKADATVVVASYTVPYDGLAHNASVTSITGVNGETGATVGTVDVSNTAHTGANTYSTDSWSFTGTANYNNIASNTITDKIDKANATVVVAPYTVTYDGSSHTATVTSITGVNGEIDATVGAVTLNATHTEANTYSGDSWSFTGTTNYNNIGNTAITDTIDKANATVVVTPYTVTYNGLPHTAVVTSITGVNGEKDGTVGAVDVSHTTHTDASAYAADYWTFAGTTNYNSIGNMPITDTINKANATVVVAPYTVPYDGGPHTATVTSITGVNGETDATVGAVTLNTTHTAADTYSGDSWSFTGTTNYNNIGNTPITDTINKANATVVVTPYTVTYNGLPHTATVVSITGVNGETDATVGAVDVSHTTHTDASAYTADYWSLTGTANYNSIAGATITDTIYKANATIVVTPYTLTYDGGPHSAAVSSITGVNGEMDATVGAVTLNTTHTTANAYPGDSWSFTGTTNYKNIATTTITDTIYKANAAVVVTPYAVTYDGSSHSAAVTSITGVNGETGSTVGTVDVSNTAHTGADTYTGDSWSFTGAANYKNIASTTITDAISQASSWTTITCPASVVYNGSAQTPCTATATGAGSLSASVSVTYASNANVGTATANATYAGDSNHTGSTATAKTFGITPKSATVTTQNNSKFYSQPDPSPLTTATLYGFVPTDGVSASFSRAAGTAVGNYAIATSLSSTASALGNYSIVNPGATFTINADTTSLTYIGPTSSTYGLCSNVTLSARLVDSITGSAVSNATVKFTLGTQGSVTAVTDANGIASVAFNVTQNAGTVSLVAEYAGGSTLAPSGSNVSFTINPSSNVGPVTGGSLYTGALLVWTTSSTSNTATVTLSTTVQDTGCGNVSTGKVTFAIRNGATYTPIPSATNLPIGLVTPGVVSVGTASAIVQLSTGNATYAAFEIAVILGGSGSGPGNYNLNNPAYDQEITVVQPGAAASIAGSGTVDLNASPAAAGYLATNAGTANSAVPAGSENYMKVSAGVTYNKSFTNPQGKVTLLINSFNKPDGTVGTTLRTYLISSNSIASLTSPVKGAVYYFSGKANIQDITNPAAPVSIDGNCTFQMTTVNSGASYQSVTYPHGGIQIEVQSQKGNVWIAGGWTGTQPQMKPQASATGGVAGN